MKYCKFTLTLLILNLSVPLWAQLEPGVYHAQETLDQGQRHYLLLVADDYMIHTVYDHDPNQFVDTKGGFYKVEGDSLLEALEFNFNFESDGERIHRAQIYEKGGEIVFNGNIQRSYQRKPTLKQELDGQWLFATRGPDTGQERRRDHVPRKTLKFLQDGYFQWIAYHTETMEFSGTGGGHYTAEEGNYTEKIHFFSRDSSRVGAELQFQYEIKGKDWHHQGKNSRGEPMYEIWSSRSLK
jgi:hypothetical protein